MRYGPDDKLWCVSDPKPTSVLGDICVETSLRSLELRFRGGLSVDENPTLFTDRTEAESEAHRRLVAVRAAEAISLAVPAAAMRSAARVALLDGEGRVLFEAELGR